MLNGLFKEVEIMIGKFLVIEGLDATGKSTLATKLARHLRADLLMCPGEIEVPGLSDGDVRSYFDSRPPLQRRAFYRAANLFASEKATLALNNNHVVMDRYWPSTFAYSALDHGFDIDDKYYGIYPPEIRKPDVVFLLTVNEDKRLERINTRGQHLTREEQDIEEALSRREDVLQRYRMFFPIEIDTSHLDSEAVLNSTLDALYDSKIILM